MSDIYNGFSLRRDDDDGALRFGGAVRTPAEIGAGHHVKALRDDLVRLGFFLAREGDIAKRGKFDRWLEEAVREFQVMARLPTVAHERADPSGEANYLRRLESVNVTLDQRYPLPDSGLPDCFASGIVNATTRHLIALWKANDWRCPWVIAEWSVPAKKPKKLKVPRPEPTPAPGTYKVGHRTLARTDLTVTGRTPKIKGEVFLHDFSDWYRDGENPAEPMPRFYLGREVSYGARRGPGAFGSSDPAVRAAQIPVTPNTLTGADIVDLESAAASTFRVVGAVASVEVTTGLQMINAYDLACQSAGLFHFALVTPGRHPNVGKGELGGVFSLLENSSPDQFNNFIGNFGIRHEIVWGGDGNKLLNRVSGVWESFSCRETEESVRGERVDNRLQADVLQSWQWLARLNMLAFVSPAYRSALWTLARMRLGRIQSLSIGGGYPAAWTVGAVFSSERLMAKILRIHVKGSMKLATLPTQGGTPICRKWVHDVLKVLTAQEVNASPSKWSADVLDRIEARVDARFPAYSKDHKDQNNHLVKADFTKMTEWRWEERSLNSAPNSFKLDVPVA